ncbi:MAG TPA: NAD(P)-dependent oxidoreductase [Elusimicrobia bacterium]|nr:NAD(P)-dependent oxidoreductase [Elusimicrobiota bacterium]
MRALIIGSSGQVGSNLERACAVKGLEVYGADIKPASKGLYIDVSEPVSVRAAFETAQPGVVFLCAAMTYVDGCEKNPALAEKINVKGTEITTACCREAGSKLVYLSTEYVFDGKNGPYSETDAPNPVSVYGRTKLEGERLALALKSALSIRTTVVYSYAPGEKNFLMQLIDAARSGVKMRVPKDQYSNPTYAPELAEFMVELVLKNKIGIYNVVGAERMERYSFALKACEILGLNTSLIEPALTSELGQTAARPLSAGLKTDKLKKELGRAPLGASDSLSIIKGLLSNGRSA